MGYISVPMSTIDKIKALGMKVGNNFDFSRKEFVIQLVVTDTTLISNRCCCFGSERV